MKALLHWSRTERVSAARMLTAAVGMATPVVAGALTGHVAAGMAAAMGGLAMSEVGDTGSASQRVADVLLCLAAVMLAVLLGTFVTRRGLPGAAAMVAAAALASALGSTSREAAKATMKFTIFMAIATYASWPGGRASAMVLDFGLGAAWAGAAALVLSVAFHLVTRALRTPAAPAPASAAARRPWPQRLVRAASRREAWSYTLRLVTALAAAQLVRALWPSDHAYWVVVTAALVVTRATAGAHLRALQRTLGTMVGVVVGTLLLAAHAPTWAVLAAIALIAGLRPLLKARNYLAYSAVMTPLVVMLLEFGRPFDPSILVERLLATLAGCAIAMAADFVAPATPRQRP
ncbi:MAG TPA: FUSC family protein [Usitatibacter sp.]|jgi:hypothetical protein|nr:FUSC family protein [Usitatibacter sp.]